MESEFNAVEGGTSHAIRTSALTTNPCSALISSRRARSTATMASTSAMVASFITLGLATDCAADRWKRFLSNISHTAAASGFNMNGHALILVKRWREHVRASANAATAS
jgi:hypothetical protein